MKTTASLLLFALALFSNTVYAQTGPWARYDQELKDGALYREASGGNLEEVKSIVAGGGNVKVQMKQTLTTPLMAAAGSGKIAVVKYLLDQGADPAAKDWWGQTAIDKARSVGAKDIEELLTDIINGKKEKPDTRPAPQPAPPAARKPKKEALVINAKASPAAWPLFGTYKVGDSVLYWVPTGWRRGVIKEVGIINNPQKKFEPTEKKYLIDPDAYALGNDWYEWSGVVKLQRQPFWTGWFIGQWQIGEVQAHHNEVKSGKETDTYYYMDAAETLQVLANGTYRWRLMDGKIKTGKWIPVANEPGIVLLKAYRDFDWTLRNATGIHDWQIRKLDMINLKPSAQVMSINGKRKTTAL